MGQSTNIKRVSHILLPKPTGVTVLDQYSTYVSRAKYYTISVSSTIAKHGIITQQ
jgi:hypothetical protein